MSLVLLFTRKNIPERLSEVGVENRVYDWVQCRVEIPKPRYEESNLK